MKGLNYINLVSCLLCIPCLAWGVEKRTFPTTKLTSILNNAMYVASDKLYLVTEQSTGIRGELIMPTATEINYQVKWCNNVIKNGSLEARNEWEIKEIPLLIGLNTVEIVAIDKNNQRISQTLKILNISKDNEKGAKLNKKDNDKDGLLNYEEVYLGTNEQLGDTDGDGLTDYAEIYQVLTNPLLKDTDGNGCIDSLEDFDKDLLNNMREVYLKSNPYNRDTDLDDLEDLEEWLQQTDINDYDTDNDLVVDGFEVMYHLNPLKKDSNEDGLGDSTTVIEITKSLIIDDAISIYMRGVVDIGNLEVIQLLGENGRAYQWLDNVPEHVGPIIQLMGDSLIREGELIIDSSEVTLESDKKLVLYTYDELSECLEPITTLKKENNKYIVDVDVIKGKKILILKQPVSNEESSYHLGGFRDSEQVLNIYDRELAILAHLAYTEEDIDNLLKTDIDENIFMNLASIEEVAKWEKIHTFKRDIQQEDFRKTFAANVYRSTDNIVVAYRGTDGTQDWIENFFIYPLPFIPHPQAQDAKSALQKVMRMYPDSNIYVTGHSLGGYLALYATGSQKLQNQAEAIVKCINFNALGMDRTTSGALKRSLKKLSKEDILYSHKVYLDMVSVIGTHYTTMQQVPLAQIVKRRYEIPPVEKWKFAKERHDMANFYEYLKIE